MFGGALKGKYSGKFANAIGGSSSSLLVNDDDAAFGWVVPLGNIVIFVEPTCVVLCAMPVEDDRIAVAAGPTY